MTGAEAWSLVAPILALYVTPYKEGKLDKMSEAYVTVFGALTEMDERKRENGSKFKG